MSYAMPRSLQGMAMLYSSPSLGAETYRIMTGGTLTGGTEEWNGWSEGGSWTGGSEAGSFTVSGTVTTVGNSGFGGGGQPGEFPGGGRPW